jgi:hypothetical protein
LRRGNSEEEILQKLESLWFILQHLFSQSYGKTSRRLNPLPADPYTSASYIDYAENRPLLINEFELKHPMNYHHLQLLKTGEGNLGPLPDGI